MKKTTKLFRMFRSHKLIRKFMRANKEGFKVFEDTFNKFKDKLK